MIGRRPSTAKAWSCSGSWTLFPVVLQWLENRKSDTKPILLDWLSAQLPGASISLGTSAETAAALRRQYTEPMETWPLTTAVRGKSPGSRCSSPQTARRSWRGPLGRSLILGRPEAAWGSTCQQRPYRDTYCSRPSLAGEARPPDWQESRPGADTISATSAAI